MREMTAAPKWLQYINPLNNIPVCTERKQQKPITELIPIMSEIVDKLTTTKFSSASASHIYSYPAVKSVVDFIYSFSIVQFLYTQLAPYVELINTKVSGIKPVYDTATFVDSNFDRIVLTRVDLVLASLPDVSPYYPTTLFRKSVAYINKGYLAPINSFVYSHVDAHLPATLTENKATFKAADLSAGAEDEVFTEVYKFAKIVNDILLRSKAYLSSKKDVASETLITTYNKEFEKLGEGNYYYKSGQASYNTGVAIINDVNSEYIQPLKTQTQGYVHEVAQQTRSKADSYISDVKSNLSTNAESVHVKSQELLNGTVVSASA